jgi:hypothetical protein
MATDSQAPVLATGQPKLRRNLTVWEAIGISMALMAPSMAASIKMLMHADGLAQPSGAPADGLPVAGEAAT